MPEEECRSLEGIRVVEIGGGLAALILGRLLNDQGAAVIRIRGNSVVAPFNWVDPALEAAIGPHVDQIEIDAGNALSAFAQAVSGADVLIDTVPGDRREAVELAPDRLRARFPRLVHLTMPGFPSGDPEHAGEPAWEGVLGAACGLFTDVNPLRSFLRLDPVYSALPYASVYGAVHGAIAVGAALVARRDDPRGGRHIEVPLVAAGLSAMSSQILRIPAQPERYDVPWIPRWTRRRFVPLARAILRVAPPIIQHHVARIAGSLTPPLMDSFACKDGALLYLFAIDHDRAARDLLAHLGLLEALRHDGIEDRDAYGPASRSNLREGGALSGKWRRRIRRALAARLREKDAEEWERELTAAGFACAVQRTTAEWLRRTELARQGVVEQFELPGFGRVVRPGRQVWLHRVVMDSDETASPRVGDGPGIGRGIGPGTGGGLLSGLRVLDLSAVVAGPVAARTLAEYGADVTKVISPRPHHGPRITCWYGIDVDRGKRSILLDLATEGGRDVLRRLVERTDVVVHNFTGDAAERLSLTPEALAELRPGVVLCKIGAFRGPEPGPWSERRGYDPVLQAASGIMRRYGDPGHPEHHGIASCVDYLTGYCAAFSVTLAVLARSSGDCAGAYVAETALAQGALLVQAPYAIEIAGQIPMAPSGQSIRGTHALNRLYHARDNWIFLAAPPADLGKITTCIGLDPASCADVSDADTVRALAQVFRSKPAQVWRERLSDEQVAVWIVESIDAQRERWIVPLAPGDAVESGPAGQVLRTPHAAGGLVDTLAPTWARIEGAPLRVPGHTPQAGADTEEVLGELGYDAATIAKLIANGTAARRLSERYLPA